jgi:hypothetical protein
MTVDQQIALAQTALNFIGLVGGPVAAVIIARRGRHSTLRKTQPVEKTSGILFRIASSPYALPPFFILLNAWLLVGNLTSARPLDKLMAFYIASEIASIYYFVGHANQLMFWRAHNHQISILSQTIDTLVEGLTTVSKKVRQLGALPDKGAPPAPINSTSSTR